MSKYLLHIGLISLPIEKKSKVMTPARCEGKGGSNFSQTFQRAPVISKRGVEASQVITQETRPSKMGK